MNWRTGRTLRPRWKYNSGTPEAEKSSSCEGSGRGNQANSSPSSSGKGTSNSLSRGDSSSSLRLHIDATLGSGNLRAAVKLPAGEDYDEWLAVNTIDFYSAVTLLYGVVAEFCTETSCPIMNAGPKYEYRWADGVKIKKPIQCSAPRYIEYLMEWVENQVENAELFPKTPGAKYSPKFREVVRTILRRLFRIYAHIYHCHFRDVCSLGAEAHLNTCFKHFVYFVQEFKLIDNSELAPLQEIISGM